MLNKTIILTSLFIFSSIALAGEYDAIKEESSKSKTATDEIEYWMQEANILVAQIDAALKRYENLKSEANNEIDSYQKELTTMIEAERQRKELVEKDCKEKNVNCNIINIHQANIDKFQDRIKRLDEVKVKPE